MEQGKISYDETKDDMTCKCGNTSATDGFIACNEDGLECEPSLDWKGRYLCQNCGATFDLPERADKWRALLSVMPEQVGNFMWMQAIDWQGTVIHCYKHCMTRRYLNLDVTGQAWGRKTVGPTDVYARISMEAAKQWALS